MTREPAGVAIPDGVYVNPRVTMADGHIVAVENGPAVAVVPPAPCGAGTAVPTGPGGQVLLSADACNLMTMVEGRLLTKTYFQIADGSPIEITGCGTAGNPFLVTLTLPEAAGGATFTGCGITINNGRVTAFTPPVMNVLADEDTGIEVDPDPLTCTLTLRRASGATSAKLPVVVCDSSTDPTNGQVVGTPDITYTFRLPNLATTVYVVTTSAAGLATITNMATGVYEVLVGGTSLGYVTYTRCTYVAP